MIFKRKIYQKILQWKNEHAGKYALLVEGARRVGKSTVVKAFAKAEYESYILIDFSNAPKSVFDLFEDTADLNFVFTRLQLQYGVQLKQRKSLIVFDEVQFCPRARQAIKVLVQDGRYDYLETGSLVSIRKNVADILIPSEEMKVQMFPMDYEEFRWAMGDETSTGLLRDMFNTFKAAGDNINRKLMREFRLYMLVGGMPQ